MQLLSPKNWKDYELLDAGNFEKLERFGQYITIRPEPQAVWPKVWSNADWEKQAHVKFVPKSSSQGEWKKLKQMPDQWKIKYEVQGTREEKKEIQFRLGLTAFKHVGVFPEQAVNWDAITGFMSKMEKPKFLNLFAYTGGASIAAKAAGADVTHVDSIKQVVSWANENMQLSGLDNIRWMVDDALKFVKKEVRRGNTYNGIILDPPAYGHGPNGEKWKLEDNITEMIDEVLRLLNPDKHLLILNAYSLGFSSIIIENLLRSYSTEKKSELESGELFLTAKSGIKLPLGVWGRLTKG
jgi:23S rRNA (cytosine1962-C5)-methyltransferase